MSAFLLDPFLSLLLFDLRTAARDHAYKSPVMLRDVHGDLRFSITTRDSLLPTLDSMLQLLLKVTNYVATSYLAR